MIKTSAHIYWNALCNHFFRSLKEVFVYILLIVFIACNLLLYHYLQSYNRVYISRLKGLYPEIYSQQTNLPQMPSYRHVREIFRISSDFNFFYHPEAERIRLEQVGIRSIAHNHNPDIMDQFEVPNNQRPYILLNTALYQLVASASDFNGESLFLSPRMTPYERLSGKTANLIEVRIKPFDWSGEHPWLLLTNHLANQLKMKKNITTIYPMINGCGQSIHQIQQQYAAAGITTILWSDRLPFFYAMLYALASRVYHVFALTFFCLILFITISVFSSPIAELKKLITLSQIYGGNKQTVYFVFTGFVSAYVSLGFIVSWGVAVLCNYLLQSLSTVLNQFGQPPFTWTVFLLVLAGSILSILFFVGSSYLAGQKGLYHHEAI